MYKGASQNQQGRADRGSMWSTASGPTEDISPKEQHAIIKDRLVVLRAALLATEEEKQRKIIGREIALCNQQIATLRDSLKTPDITPYFMDAARAILPREDYDAIKKHAHLIYDLRNKDKATRPRQETAPPLDTAHKLCENKNNSGN